METTEFVTEALADVHVHLREGDVVPHLIFHSIAGGADVLGAMPNTTKGLMTAGQVTEYINQAGLFAFRHEPPVSFIPFVMITEKTTEKEIDDCIAVGITHAKVYPYQRTTQSEYGVTHYQRIIPIIRHCGKVGMTCHFHPEHPWMLFGNREAEFCFIPVMKMFFDETAAHIVWEHGTDAQCIPFWEEMAKTGRFGLTLTAHHLASNEDLTFGDIRATCKPPIKTERDRRGLVDLVCKNYDWVMAGTDTAFHDWPKKHVEKGRCNCGAFTAPFALPLYAHALEKLFSSEEGFQTFINFTSRNARKRYKLPESSRQVKLVRKPWEIPLKYEVGPQTASPFWAGQILNWKIADY